MAYLGKQPTVGNFVILDSISATATDTFALTSASVAYAPQSANHCIVSLNGVIQAPISSFTISGTNIVFASALTTDDTIDFIQVLGDVLNIGTPSDGTVGIAKLSATGTKDATTFLRGDNTFAAAGGGKVLQVVTATDSTIRTTTSTSFVTASNTLSVSITPSSTSSKIFLISNFNLHINANETYAIVTIYRNATDVSGGASGGLGRIWSKASSMPIFPMAISYLDSPSSTSAITYQIYTKVSGSGTIYLGGLDSGAVASITAFEIGA